MKSRFGYFISTLTIALVAIVSTGCGRDNFLIEGKVEGVDRLNLRSIYYANGTTNELSTSTIDGEFSFEGWSATPTIVEIYTSNRILLGRIVIKNGEEISCKLNQSNPYDISIDGNDLSAQWADFLRDNSETLKEGDHKRINELIAAQIDSNPTEALSGLLFVTLYDASLDPAGAQELLEKIDQTKLPSGALAGLSNMLAAVNVETAKSPVKELRLYSSDDSIKIYTPAKSKLTLLTFSSDKAGRNTLVSALKDLSNQYRDTSLTIIDISLDFDTTQWKRSIAKDSASWEQAWAPGSHGAESIIPLAITEEPYFIVTDSTGNQLYRSEKLSGTTDFINQTIK